MSVIFDILNLHRMNKKKKKKKEEETRNQDVGPKTNKKERPSNPISTIKPTKVELIIQNSTKI